MAQNITIVNTEYNSSSVPVNALFNDTIKIKKNSKIGLKSFQAIINGVQKNILKEQRIVFHNLNLQQGSQPFFIDKDNILIIPAGKVYESPYEMLTDLYFFIQEKSNIVTMIEPTIMILNYAAIGRNFKIARNNVNKYVIRMERYPQIITSIEDLNFFMKFNTELPPPVIEETGWIVDFFVRNFQYCIKDEKIGIAQMSEINDFNKIQPLNALVCPGFFYMQVVNFLQKRYIDPNTEEDEINVQAEIEFICTDLKKKYNKSCIISYEQTNTGLLPPKETTWTTDHYLRPEIKIILRDNNTHEEVVKVIGDEFLNYVRLWKTFPKKALKVGIFSQNYIGDSKNYLEIIKNEETNQLNLKYNYEYYDFADKKDNNDGFFINVKPSEIPEWSDTNDEREKYIGPLHVSDFQDDNIKLIIDGVTGYVQKVEFQLTATIAIGPNSLNIKIPNLIRYDFRKALVISITKEENEPVIVGEIRGAQLGEKKFGAILLHENIFPDVAFDGLTTIQSTYRLSGNYTQPTDNVPTNVIKIGTNVVSWMNNNKTTDLQPLGNISIDFSEAEEFANVLGLKKNERFFYNNNDKTYELQINNNLDRVEIHKLPKQLALDIDNIKIKSFRGLKNSNDPLNRGRTNTLAIFNPVVDNNFEEQKSLSITYESPSDAYTSVDINENMELTSLNYRFYNLIDNKPLIADKVSFNLINID